MRVKERTPTFSTPLGKITGFIDSAVIRATGIPYATAGRFEKPKPIKYYSKPVEATEKSSACPQIQNDTVAKLLGIDLQKELKISENCLNLSVTRPNNQSKNLPVMVWIHGGSYIMGAGDVAYTNPKNLVAEQEVIVVSITYRLGIFGFLGGYNEVPPNLGYLDIWEGLRWVKENIESFGGNPDNICLFGQSAGGDAIAQLMLIDETKDLFHKAIIQSAPLGIIRNKKKMIQNMINKAEKIPKNASAEALIRKQNNIIKSSIKYGFKGGMPFGAQYGEYPFPDEKNIDRIWRERTKEVPVLIGHTRDETSFFLAFSGLVKGVFQIPFVGNLMKRAAVNFTTTKVYRRGAEQFVANCKTSKNSYSYELFWGSGKNFYGAMHCIDLPLLFWEPSKWSKTKLLKGIKASEIEEKGKKVRQLWADFACCGRLQSEGAIEGVLTYKKE